MITKLKKVLLFSLLGLSYGYLTYLFFGKWWNSSVGSILIMFFSYLIWNKDFLKNTGLKLTALQVFKTIIFALIITTCSFLIIKHIADKQNIEIIATNWRNYYHDVFYILNEEIVIGAILLFDLVDKRKIPPIIASVGLAFVFSILHFALYKWQMREKGILELTTLGSLFFVGFVRNNFILQTGHIGYSWALHFGWMVIMFGCLHVDSVTNRSITEPDRFNIYLGSVEMLIISGILAGLSLAYWIKSAAFNKRQRPDLSSEVYKNL